MFLGNIMPSQKIIKVQIGDIFGQLVVLEASSGFAAKSLCRCTCGKQKQIPIRSMLRGYSKSCGCRRAHLNSNKTSSTISKPYRMQWRKYVANAKTTNREWKLTEHQFINLVTRPCFYCGSAPRNGVDRLDSMLGYVFENCVPCCFDCNRMKSNKDAFRFVEQAKKIAQYNTW